MPNSVPGPLISFLCLPVGPSHSGQAGDIHSLVPFPAMDEKAILHVSLGRTDWQSVIYTGIRGFYSHSFVNTDLDLVMDDTTLPRVMIHSLEATVFQSLSLHVSDKSFRATASDQAGLTAFEQPLSVSPGIATYTRSPGPSVSPPRRFLAHFPEEVVEMTIYAAHLLLNFGLTSKDLHLLSHDPRL